ncbi:MAG: TAXI family TRAP transporter solute-binding subunit [Burkholderiaceae bacterium]
MVQLVIRALLALALVLLAGCQRGPDQEIVRSELQSQLDAALGGHVLQIENLRRSGSTAVKETEGRGRLVYYNARLQLTRDYDFTKWDAHSVATLADLLGAGAQGISGLKREGNVAGDVIGVYGRAAFVDDSGRWGLVPTAPAQREIEQRLQAAAGAAGTIEQAAAAASAKVAQVDVLNREIPPTPAEQSIAQIRGLLAARSNIPPAEREAIVTAELDRAWRNARARIEQYGTRLLLVAAPPGGAYAETAAALRSRAEFSKLPLEISDTEGSVANIRLLAAGRADFALVQNDIAAAAYAGTGRFAGAPQRELRAVASLFPEAVQLVARAGSGIANVQDLAGKKVNLGPEGSGTRANALEVLANAGLDPAQLIAFDLAPAPAAAKLTAGEIDALFYTVHAPAPILQAVAARAKVTWVTIPANDATRTAGLLPITLPARTYAGQNRPVDTVAATALMVTRADVPAEKVVQMVRLLFEPRAADVESAILSHINARTAREGVTIPWYPAAAALLKPAPQPP